MRQTFNRTSQYLEFLARRFQVIWKKEHFFHLSNSFFCIYIFKIVNLLPCHVIVRRKPNLWSTRAPRHTHTRRRHTYRQQFIHTPWSSRVIFDTFVYNRRRPCFLLVWSSGLRHSFMVGWLPPDILHRRRTCRHSSRMLCGPWRLKWEFLSKIHFLSWPVCNDNDERKKSHNVKWTWLKFQSIPKIIRLSSSDLRSHRTRSKTTIVLFYQ